MERSIIPGTISIDLTEVMSRHVIVLILFITGLLVAAWTFVLEGKTPLPDNSN